MNRWASKLITYLTLGCAFIGLNSQYSKGAVVVNLTTAGNSGTINGAIYQQIDPSSTGSGVIDSIARIQPGGSAVTSSGYNTTANGVFDTGSTDTFNHAITLGDVPLVNLSGTNYRQFLLDINENTGNGDQYISLDEVQIFAGGTANSSVTTFTGGVLDHDGTLVYRMDAGADNWVAMDYSLNSGSGSGDMFLYVPDSVFSAFADAADVTIYSAFGLQGVNPTAVPAVPAGNYNVSDGYEDWAVLTGTGGTRPGAAAPEPMSLLVWSTLLGTYGACYAFRRNRQRTV